MSNPYKRQRSPDPEFRGRPSSRVSSVPSRAAPYISRWNPDNAFAKLLGYPTKITATMTTEQLAAYQTLVRIEEISLKLKFQDFNPPHTVPRSPSPPPEYDSQGKRTNTRQARYKKKLEDERHKLVEYALANVPQYRPPPDYKKPSKTVEKVYIPVKDHPDVNFIGLLLGPRGNTLKQMQQDSGARIAIRGKGSVKGGKNPAGITSAQNNLEDDLHCLITSENEDKIAKAITLVNSVIDRAINAPVGQNDLKRNQLRDLAVLNGTLRVQHDDGRPCPICGMPGHRRWACPNKDSRTGVNAIVCNFCGTVGHIERDCRLKHGGGGGSGVNGGSNIDNEINQFMMDLQGDGEGNDGVEREVKEEERGAEDEGPVWKRRKGQEETVSGQEGLVKRKGPPGLAMGSSVPGISAAPAPPPPRPPAPPALLARPPPPPSVRPPPPPPTKKNPPPKSS